MPADLADAIPCGESSSARQLAAAAPSRRAAVRYTSGAGLPRASSMAEQRTVMRVRPSRSQTASISRSGDDDAIGASDVALFGNITPEFSSTLGTRTVAERARSASFLGLDVILISGPEAGVPFAMSDLRAAKQAAPQTPVLANTGVTADRLAETLAVADGVIVGTSLKVDGITWNRVDPARARRFMDTARQARSAPAVVS